MAYADTDIHCADSVLDTPKTTTSSPPWSFGTIVRHYSPPPPQKCSSSVPLFLRFTVILYASDQKWLVQKTDLIIGFYSHINLDFKSISPYPQTKLAVLPDFLQVCFKNISSENSLGLSISLKVHLLIPTKGLPW